MLDYKQFLELTYLDFKQRNIHIPRIGVAVLITDDCNCDEVAAKLLSWGYKYSTKELRMTYKGFWKNKLTQPDVLADAKVILVDVEYNVIINWSLPLTDTSIKMCECFFTCIEGVDVLESDSLLCEDFVEKFKGVLNSKPENLNLYEDWFWTQQTMLNLSEY